MPADWFLYDDSIRKSLAIVITVLVSSLIPNHLRLFKITSILPTGFLHMLDLSVFYT